LNPTLYFLGNGTRYGSDFHDVTTGNNGTYPAVRGYDNSTGWGSFNGGPLMNDLQVDADTLHVDAAYTGAQQDGGPNTPFKTVVTALNAASSSRPTLIYIKGSTYLDYIPNANKKVTMVNNGGGSVIVR